MVEDWIKRGCNLKTDLVEIGQSAHVTRLDANSNCRHKTLFASNKDKDRYTYDDLSFSRFSSEIFNSSLGNGTYHGVVEPHTVKKSVAKLKATGDSIGFAVAVT